MSVCGAGATRKVAEPSGRRFRVSRCADCSNATRRHSSPSRIAFDVAAETLDIKLLNVIHIRWTAIWFLPILYLDIEILDMKIHSAYSICMPSDFIDNLMQRWLAQRPELDASPIAVIGRAIRIADVLKRELKELLRPYGLEVWEFDLLATLRWGGNEDGLTPKELIDVVMVSSGTMTHRLDRLEKSGFVKRVPNPNDRRSIRIQLAKRGIEVVEKSLTAHLASAEQAVSELSQREQQQTARVLKKILAKIEPSRS